MFFLGFSEAGFIDVELTPISAPMWLGARAEDAWEFVSQMGLVKGLVADLSEEDRHHALNELHRRIIANETADGVLLGSAAWLITARQR